MENKLNLYISTLQSENTKKAYKRNIESFLSTCNEITLESYLAWTATIAGEAGATQYQKIMAVRGFIGFLFDLGDIDSETYMRIKKQKTPKVNNEKKLPLNAEQVQAILRQTRTPRERAMLMVLFHTGMRIGELLNIKLNDLNADGVIKVVGKGNKFRYCYINEETMQVIKEYLKTRKESEYDNLFIGNQGKPMQEQNFNKTIKLLANRAGINVEALNFSCHSTRHTTISMLAEKGVTLPVLQEIAGHADIRTTKRYIDNNPTAARDAVMGLNFQEVKMKLAKIYNEVIKARLKDKRILLGDFDDETIGVSLDGYVMYFIPKNNFLLDENKILNTRDKMNLKNFKEPDELICVFQSCEYREYRERLLLKIGDKYVDKKLLQNFEKPSFKTTNSKYSAIYIYELDTLVGLVMPVNIKED